MSKFPISHSIYCWYWAKNNLLQIYMSFVLNYELVLILLVLATVLIAVSALRLQRANRRAGTQMSPHSEWICSYVQHFNHLFISMSFETFWITYDYNLETSNIFRIRSRWHADMCHLHSADIHPLLLHLHFIPIHQHPQHHRLQICDLELQIFQMFLRAHSFESQLSSQPLSLHFV